MNEEMQYTDELLMDYVDGLLGTESRTRVEKILDSNEEAQTIVAGIQAFYEKNGKDRDALEAWLEQGKKGNITSTEDAKVRKLNIWPKVLISVAAAAILVFAFVALQDTRHSIADDFASLPVEVEFETRSNNDLAQVQSAFDNLEYSKVLDLSEGEFEESIQLDFMVGVSYFKTENYQMAVAYLSGLEETRLAEYADWYVALSYAMTEQNDRAERSMKAIAEGNGKYASSAQQWLAAAQD